VQLDEIADELYAVAPGAFVAQRDGLVKAARADGDRELATRIAALKRPTISAWMVNALVRARREVVEQLLALGDQMREAQSSMAGDELRQLSAQRQQVVAALVSASEQLARAANIRTDADASREVQETLLAALADPAAAKAVATGRLTKPARYAGFGVELPELAVVPEVPARKKAAPKDTPARGAKPKAAEREASPRVAKADEAKARRLAAAEEALAVAESERDARRDELAAAEDVQAQAAAHVKELRAGLADAERRFAEASLDLRTAKRDLDVAERSVTKARATRDRASN
jgi:hypothetical protein